MRATATACALLLCLAAGGCGLDRHSEPRQVPPELIMEGVRFWIDREGVTQARGRADRITIRRDTTDVTAETMTLLMSTVEGDLRMSAPTVSGVIAERRFHASGGLTAERGVDVAVTESATFEPPQAGEAGTGRVHGQDPVTVTGPGYRLDGSHGFTLEPASGQIVLGRGARLVSGLPVQR